MWLHADPAAEGTLQVPALAASSKLHSIPCDSALKLAISVKPGPAGAGLRPDSRFNGNWGPAPPRFRLETHWLRVCTRHHYYATGMATVEVGTT